eukprot:12324357-Alexandrium_andersonii.AAC.1
MAKSARLGQCRTRTDTRATGAANPCSGLQWFATVCSTSSPGGGGLPPPGPSKKASPARAAVAFLFFLRGTATNRCTPLQVFAAP